MSIKDMVFDTVGFKYDGEFETFESDAMSVSFDGKVCKIGYASIPQLARGYFLFAMNYKKGTFEINEKPAFKTCGCMIDVSRNAVLKVSAVKDFMNFMACLGMNMLMLYTEDTYEIKEQPYFGHMRGRYTKAEIREIVEYGRELGIEIIPCIQTLGHMEQFLKYWEAAGDIMDTKDILLAEEKKTLEFIETEIKTVREMFDTDRIHIGMDEAHDLGRGKYLDKNGFKNPYDILSGHLSDVVEICKKYNFRPMMWNDMFFRVFAPNKDYYNYKEVNYPEGYAESIPDVDMVYWDYYPETTERCKGMIEKSNELGKGVIYAGGISIWNTFLPFGESERYAEIGVKASAENGVDEVICTLWGDDGNETNYKYALPYIPIFSEYCYKGESCTKADIEEVSEFITKIPFELTRAMGKSMYNVNHGKPDGYKVNGKNYFYSDIMYGLGVHNDKYDIIAPVFEESAKEIADYMNANGYSDDLEYAKLVFEIISCKADVIKKLRDAYSAGDKEYIKITAEKTLPELKEKYIALKEIHKNQWFDTYKPFGFEVISFRYGGTISRIDDVIDRLKEYVDGKVETIPEFEEEWLFGRGGFTNRVITPSYIY